MNDQALKDKVVSGLRWTVLTRGTTQLFTWVATLIVARLLNPSDYGLVAMATIVSSYLMLLGEMGFSVALIQRRELDETTRRSVFGFLLLGGGILFVALSGFAPLISRYFSEPRLTPLILVVGVQFLLIPFSVIPQANLSIAMRFRALGTAGLASATMGAVTTLWLAYCHFGAYALVVGTVVTAFSRAVILNILAPFLRRPLLRARLVSKLANFSGYVLLERTVWYWYAQADTVIAGSMLGAAGLGAYAIGASALQVVGAPYHRNNAGNAAVYRFFLGSPAKAQVIAKDWRVRYVAFCPDSFGELGAVDPLSLIAQLRAGHIPSWMRPMEGPDDGLTLFAIEPRLFERPATL